MNCLLSIKVKSTLVTRLSHGCFGLWVLLMVGPTSGATLTWGGGADNWDTDANWLPAGTEPTATDDAIINVGGVDVTLPGETAGSLTVGDTGTGTLNINSGGVLNTSTGFLSRRLQGQVRP